MKKQNARFVAETIKGKQVLTFYLDGELIEPAQAVLEELPIPGSIELTLEDYRQSFPEDTVEFEDRRNNGN